MGSTKKGPKWGDCVLHCGHVDNTDYWYFFVAPNLVRFLRSDGTEGVAKWIVTCRACYTLAGGDFDKIKILGDAVWQGNQPTLRAREHQ